jgi:hypothetical protein
LCCDTLQCLSSHWQRCACLRAQCAGACGMRALASLHHLLCGRGCAGACAAWMEAPARPVLSARFMQENVRVLTCQ